MNGFMTKAIHGGLRKKDPHGSLRFPVYDNVAFEFETARDLELSFEGKKPAHAYSRISNPTVEDFEQRVKTLADALCVIAVSSGMAAILNVIISIAEAGTNIIASRFLFGNTISLFEHTLKPWGLSVKYVDMDSHDAIAGAIDVSTRAVFLETITNPQLQVADIKSIADIARSRDVPLIIDGTLTTPYLFRSKDFGVAIEVLSSTKYMSGGATSVGGVIIDNGTFDWGKNPKLASASWKYGPYALINHLRREVYRNIGSCLSPHNAWLQTLGLETMALRIERSCANAFAIAKFLKEQPAISSVNYPGLEDSPYHNMAISQFKGMGGGLLTFNLGTKDKCFRFMDGLKIIRRATNLNDNKTLIIHPASTIFCEYSEEQRKEMGVDDGMIRIATGIEESEDLIEDLKRGLDSI